MTFLISVTKYDKLSKILKKNIVLMSANKSTPVIEMVDLRL